MNLISQNERFPSIRTCHRCNKLLTHGYGELVSLCSECTEKDKEDFRIVKEYIQSHANTTVFDVSQATGVSIKIIMQFVKEDRIQVVDTKNKINLKD